MKKEFKCPVCKKVDFESIRVSCTRGYLYLEGYYAWLYRCKNCHIIICEDQNPYPTPRKKQEKK